jgi:hypothetical protein
MLRLYCVSQAQPSEPATAPSAMLLRAALGRYVPALEKASVLSPLGQRAFTALAEPVPQQQATSDTLRGIIADQLEAARAAGTLKRERIITTPQSAAIGYLLLSPAT